jgi:hypothetical protein
MSKKANGKVIAGAIKKYGTKVKGENGKSGTVLCVGREVSRDKFGENAEIEKKMQDVGIPVAVQDISDKKSKKKLTCIITNTDSLK